MNDPIQQQLDQLVKNNDVILFMKGTRAFPQCGFSATAVNILNELVSDFETVNVLADPDVRQGIKVYSDWPTIPQLYIKGEFIGGSDIVRQMYASGELHAKLGVTPEVVQAPQITVTDAAAEVLAKAAEGELHESLRFEVGPTFQYSLSFAPKTDGDLVVQTQGLTLLFDRGSAKRAGGLTLDYREELGGFRIDNPNAPASVKELSVIELKELLDADPALRLIDTRRPEEQALATLPTCELYTPALRAELMAMPKDTPLYFICRTGNRSGEVAAAFVGEGFTNVHNVAGGLHAWARYVDPSMPQY